MSASAIRDSTGTSPAHSPAKGVRLGGWWCPSLALEWTQSTGWEVTCDLVEKVSRAHEIPLWERAAGGVRTWAVWWQRHMEHGWSQGCLGSRATFAPIKPGSSRVLLVDPINISADIIKTNTSFFWVSMSGFLFPPTKRAFATNTAPTLGKNMQMELCLNIQGISRARHRFNSSLHGMQIPLVPDSPLPGSPLLYKLQTFLSLSQPPLLLGAVMWQFWPVRCKWMSTGTDRLFPSFLPCMKMLCLGLLSPSCNYEGKKEAEVSPLAHWRCCTNMNNHQIPASLICQKIYP